MMTMHEERGLGNVNENDNVTARRESGRLPRVYKQVPGRVVDAQAMVISHTRSQ